MIMHNLFDDIEDLSVQKSNLPKIPTVESSEEAQKIENDRKQIRENAYQTILVLYQQRNVVEKQWKKVSTKDDDYDDKFQQYIDKKQEIEDLCNASQNLFDTSSKIDENTIKRVQTLRDKLGIMRFRPMLTQKNNNQEQKWIWPVASKTITSSYGWRTHPIFKDKRFHDGIDISENNNKPIWAVASGTILKAQWKEGYGNYVEIDHGNGLHSFYGHLNSYNVKIGDYVQQGQEIGKVGSTGYSTGNHLHFGVFNNGKIDNPLKYLPKI